MATEIKSTSIKSQNIIAEPQVNKPGSPEAGQIIQATGTGDIAKGIYHYTGESFFSLDNAQGDLETLRLVLSTDTSAVDFNSALNSTSTLAGNTNAVPHETSTGTGLLGALEIPSTGGDALLTEFDANKVFRYFSAGANNNNDYFGIPIDIPAQSRGQNIVIKFKYRTEEASDTTSNGDFQVSVWDKTNGVKTTQDSTLTTGTTISAGSNILMTSKTNLSVGDKIWFETGGTGSTVGGVTNSLTQAYITEISSTDNNIKVSEDVQVIASGLAVAGFLTDKTSGLLPAADSDTNKVGKDFSIAVKTEETTAQIVLYISNKSTTTNVIELFFDGILVSQNKFLQASSQFKSESYFIHYQANVWDSTSSTSQFDASLLEPGHNSPPASQSKFVSIGDITGPGTAGTVTAITAKQDITLSWTVSGDGAANGEMQIYNSSEEIIGFQGPVEGTVTFNEATISVNLAKDDFVYAFRKHGNTRIGTMTIVAEPQTSPVVLLESQDEIFTDWIPYTPSFTGFGTPSNVSFFYKRNGDSIDIRGSFASGTTSTDIAQVGLPSGLSLDFGKLNPTEARDQYGTIFQMGTAVNYYSNQSGVGGFVALDYSFPNSICFSVLNVNQTQTQIMTGGGLTGTGNTTMVFAKNIPIAGYNSNFNPLLSMPLVEIGGNSESYNINAWAGAAGYSLYSTSTPSVNTINNLGTITNSSTQGFFFTATQRVRVTMSVFHNSSGTPAFGIAAGPSTLDFYGDSITGTDFDNYRLAVEDMHATYTQEVSGTAILNPGDKIGVGRNSTSANVAINNNAGGVSLLVEKDFSNTNMAHIIKPAVATLKNVLGGTTDGGATSAGSFEKIPLNTVQGESWFVTLNDSTDVFTLQPGTYEIDAVQPLVKANRAAVVIFDEDNSTFPIVGTSNYFDNSNVVAGESSLRGTISITTSTQFSFKYIVSNAHGTGLGENINRSDINSIYGQVKIRKLK